MRQKPEISEKAQKNRSRSAFSQSGLYLLALPVIIQLIQIFNLPAAKYFNQLTAGEEHDQRQRISRKVMMCPEEHLPVIEGALDGAIENE